MLLEFACSTVPVMAGGQFSFYEYDPQTCYSKVQGTNLCMFGINHKS